jgi:hypothetical protein
MVNIQKMYITTYQESTHIFCKTLLTGFCENSVMARIPDEALERLKREVSR